MPQLECFSQEAEQSVLGAILIDADAVHRARPILPKAERFHQERHQWIYQAILDLSDDSIPPDFLTVTDLLDKRGKLKSAGGAEYVTNLVNLVPTSLHVEHYAGIVNLEYIKRQSVQFGTKVVQAAHGAEDIGDLMAVINKGLMALETEQDTGGPVPIPTVVGEFYEDLEYWQNNPLAAGEVRGLSTGIQEWDEMMGGMENGESFVIIAARPRVGKSALCLTSAYRLAKQGKRVLFFALEMKAKTLLARLASAESKVSYKRIKRGSRDGSDWYASAEEYSLFTRKALGVGQATNFYIDETMELTVSQIRARAMTLAHRLGGLDLLVVDTGNLIRDEGRSGMNFAQRESVKVSAVRKLVKELDCVGYMTWQLNKGVDSRPSSGFGRMPTLGDLRDTGGVEEHASDVVGLYRDELYTENSQYKNVMHLLALKRRNDMDSIIKMVGFNPEYQQFYSVDMHTEVIDF